MSSAPETLITPEPRIGFRKPRRLKAAQMGAAVDRPLHQPGALQHPHVFRCAGEAHAERGRQFPDREFPFRKLTKHGSPRRIRERMKDSIEMGELFNHMV